MKRIILLLFLACFLSGCASTRDEYASYRHETAADIYNSAHASLVKGHYSDAVNGYEALDAIYPFGPYAEKGQLESIYAYYKDGDLPSAVTAADRYVRLYPRGKYADYAYYMRGVINQLQSFSWFQRKLGVDPSWRDLSGQQQAFSSFTEVVTIYPYSPYAADSLLRMRYLRNIFAQHALDLAEYYYSQRAYVAAANRASFVIQHFDGTLATPDALALMVKSYRKLKLDSLAENTNRILQANYPASNAARRL